MNPEFWKGKRVFLTGHTGFKGSWLSLWLQEMGGVVKGFSLAPTKKSMFVEANVTEGMESQLGDIRDYGILFQSIKDFEPEIVFHMAAQPLVRLSYEVPIDTYATNVMGTVHLLEACRKTESIKAIVNITSDKCYENKEWFWGYRENDAVGGYDPYSNSKGCAELVTSAYRNSYFNKQKQTEHCCALASVRAGNVIGGGDWATDRLVPDILKAFTNREEVIIRSPQAIRPWQHVLEPLAGYLTVAERLYSEPSKYAEGWNFGPQEESMKSVQWIVEKLAEYWGGKARWVIEKDESVHEACFLKLDSSKASAKLGWHSILNIEETLKGIVSWHKSWIAGCDMKAYTVNEIISYTEKMS